MTTQAPVTAGPNPYLEGNFAPVAVEHTETDLPVSGTLPDFLSGRYLRNGPNPQGDPDPATYHWFTGAGMVHGIALDGGRARWYRNRWVRSAAVASALGEPARPGPVHAGMDFAANTHVMGHAGRTFALVEAGALPYELTPELDTVGPCDFDGTLRGGYTAHPLRDPATGELHAVSYFWGWGNKVEYSVLDAAGRIRRRTTIEVGGNPMMHAFSLTEKHVVIYDLPVTFDLDKVRGASRANRRIERLLRRGLPAPVASVVSRRAGSGASGAFPYSWDPTYRARVGVLEREAPGDSIRWYDVEPCYVYHPVNAFDGPDGVVLDVVRHPKTFATEQLGPAEGPPTLDRWTIDPAAGKVREERLDDRGLEFPRVDERLVGRRHRYGYAVGFNGHDDLDDTVTKYDLAAGTSQVRAFGPSCRTGEFVMVPRRPDAAEDDGALVGLVYDAERDRSDLVVLDAGTLATVASVALPARVPHGFHGSWVPD